METKLVPIGEEWEIMKNVAEMAGKTGMFKSIDTQAKAMVVILKGWELNIPPIKALSSISIVDGRPELDAALMLGIINRDVPEAKIDFDRKNDGCVITLTKHVGKSDAVTVSFTQVDADRAELTKKKNWVKYPRRMYHWRAVSEMANIYFPELFAGCKVDSEIEINELDPTEVTEGDVKPKKRARGPNKTKNKPQPVGSGSPANDQSEPVDDKSEPVDDKSEPVDDQPTQIGCTYDGTRKAWKELKTGRYFKNDGKGGRIYVEEKPVAEEQLPPAADFDLDEPIPQTNPECFDPKNPAHKGLAARAIQLTKRDTLKKQLSAEDMVYIRKNLWAWTEKNKFPATAEDLAEAMRRCVYQQVK